MIDLNMRKRDNFVIMFHGTIIERNGLDLALESISLVKQRIPNLTFQVYGSGDFLDYCIELTAKMGLEEIVNYHGHVPLENIALAIQCADVGLISSKPSISWDYALPTRIFEYLSLEKPVIAPRTKGILDYFDEESLYFFESGNAESMSQVIFDLYSNIEQVYAVLNRGIEVYNQYRWQLQRLHFINLVTTFIDSHATQLVKRHN